MTAQEFNALHRQVATTKRPFPVRLPVRAEGGGVFFGARTILVFSSGTHGVLTPKGYRLRKRAIRRAGRSPEPGVAYAVVDSSGGNAGMGYVAVGGKSAILIGLNVWMG